MIAWDILVGNSTAQAGSTAWTHLNSLKGSVTKIVATASLPPHIVYGETLVFVEGAIRVVYDDDITVVVEDNYVTLDNALSAGIADNLTIIQ